MLLLLKRFDNMVLMSRSAEGSCLDSGSSRHIDNRLTITNNEDRVSITGFDGSTQWTAGNGYLPIETEDVTSELPAKIDITDVDYLEGVATPHSSLEYRQ